MQWDEGHRSVCLIIASLCSFTFILLFLTDNRNRHETNCHLFWKNFTQRLVSQILFLFLICCFYLFSLKCAWVTSKINSFKLQWTFPNQPTTTSDINLIRCFIHKILALLSIAVNFVLCSWFHICLFCTSNKCQYTLCTVLFCKYSFSALRIPN